MKILFTFLSFFCPSLLWAQQIVHTKHYAIEEGLENRVVHSICRPQTGLFYMLGQNGIQLFDGRSIRQDLIPYPQDFEVEEAGIYTTNKEGIVVISAEGDQVFSFDHKAETFSPIFLSKNKRARVIGGALYYLTVDGFLFKEDIDEAASFRVIREGLTGYKSFWVNGNVIFGLDSLGVLYIDTGKEVVNPSIPFRIESIEGNIGNVLWLETDKGVFSYNYENGSFQQYDEYTNVILRRDKKGNSLLGLFSNPQRLREMYLFSPSGKKAFHELLDFNDTVIDFFSEDYSKHVLLCTYNGLVHHRLSQLILPYHKLEGKRDGTFGNLVSNLFFRERDSSIYLLREVTGLMKFDGQEVEEIQPIEESMLMSGRKSTQFDAKEDVLYMAIRDKGFSTMQHYDFQTDKHSYFEMDVTPNCLKIYNDSLLIGGGFDSKIKGNNTGAIFIYNKHQDSIIYRQNFIVPTIYDLLYFKGDLYLGTVTGLYVIEDFNLDRNPRDLQLRIVDQSDNNYFFIDTLQDGQIVASKTGDGLAFVEDYSIQKVISYEQGLCNNSIASILYDSINQVYWIGTFNGLVVMDTSYTIIKTFLYMDGLPSSETNRFACAKDHQGDFYFGTINGFAKFDPVQLLKDDHLEKYEPIFARYSQANAVYQIPLNNTDARKVPYEVEKVEIVFQTRDYFTDERYQRWRYLEIASSQAEDSFSIDQGKITILLKGSGPREIVVFRKGDPKKEYMRFELIKESFWEAYAYWALSLFLVGGLLWMLLLITRKRALANQALKASEAERELAVAHLQSMRSQMNPHFIFNALGSIQYYIEARESDTASEYLSDFAMLMRLILESSKNELIPFKNEIKQLKLYVRLESMRFEDKFDFIFDIDEEIDPDFHMPPMFVQPFIENAINHGLYHLTDRKGSLLIKVFPLNDHGIQFLLRDNGIGRDASKHLRRSQHISRGMQIVQERIKALEHQAISVSLEIDDLLENGKGVGTEVRIVFKYKE